MHGTVRLVVTLDGETLVEAIPEIGFLHRGFSKSSENSTWHQVLPYTDRLNYVSPVLNNTGYIMGVEKLIGSSAPSAPSTCAFWAARSAASATTSPAWAPSASSWAPIPCSSTPSRRASSSGTASRSCAGRG